MNVLHVIWHLGLGGSQTYLINLISCIKKEYNIDSSVICLSERDKYSQTFEEMGIIIEHMDMPFQFAWRRIPKLLKVLKLMQFDIIHCHSHLYGLFWIFALQGRPTIYTEHGGGLLAGSRKPSLFYFLYHRNISKFIAISRYMSEIMGKKYPFVSQKIKIAPNGIDIKKIDMISPAKKSSLPKEFFKFKHRIGFVGRLVHQKGPLHFVNAVSKILRWRKDIVFPVIGDGVLKSKLEYMVKSLGIEDHFLFLGYRSDAISIIKHLDVFVFTSNWEPFGLALTEAMACCIPIAALHIRGAISEIIEDGIEGLIVSGENTELLSRKIISLIEDKSLREQICKNARLKVESHYSIEHNTKLVYDAYCECLN